jgi:hypothetical protein
MVLVGILIAAGIIGGVTALEQGKFITGPTNSTVTSSTTITTVTSSIQTGVLAAQITDPPNLPNVPQGTSHVFIHYSDIEAHTTDQNNSVWFTVARTGSIDLLSVLNIAMTLGSATVYSGTYNQARFDITNATVTFGGANYTATVPQNQIIVPLSNGGAQVKPNSSAGFIIQVTPTVLAQNIGGRPAFEILAAAQALPIPSESWNGSLTAPGAKIQNIDTQSWYIAPTPIGDNLTLPNPHVAEIYPTTLLVILNNTGSTPVTISALNILTRGTQAAPPGANVSTTTIVSTITTVTTITEVTTITGNSNGQTGSPADPQLPTTNSSLNTVATFLILANGSVIQPTSGSAPIPQSQVGLTIKPLQVVVLFYLGYINTLNSPNPPYSQQSIIGGQQYIIQIVTPFGSSVEFTVAASYPS